MAHAVGADGEMGGVGKIVGLELGKEVIDTAEVLAYAALIVGVGGHAHHSAKPDTLHAAPLSLAEHLKAFAEGETKLGLLLSHMKLQQAIDDTSAP